MIILAATPIGNLGDASRRLVEVLSAATVVAAEDTRVAQRLLAGLGVENRPRLIALHDHNERDRAAELVELARDQDVVLLSDAGMPTVSDPGFHLVEAAAAAGVGVTALPGPSAVLTALAVSGLPTDRFTFEGFLPRKQGERLSTLRAVAAEPRTMVFFESPNRLAASLGDIATALGADRRVVVCRELTKLYEEVRRGTAAELAAWAAEGVRGEIVVVVAGAPARAADPEAAVQQVLALVASGTRLKDAAAEVAEATGLGKRDLYQAALERRR
ncbi:16S rRNA (cytidine1402-2'-O)-methyltransferase [Leifsonia sp. 98AMF]|uniref:16S rRNA (cytidine(1402)-2'-O)-methyltransferase n=1 Tax=unclassified Leifsonia TaxID=2663824 RepID=UPI00087CB30F|nr:MULTISPECIES: 16S rRNA (cytidine(1402)-2'-O)-methyltransferase [unclassified Leifsonia]SDH49272.1 16S rRNA (cytidine1402-2'-O)-methyltransferase [Leifsonia sp. 197AMF]SDI88616.1 16S rRNA (cytidine1402-2'-O)-methyltransferase [Leifsonia sp. 466MF]SDJ92397.1 16S rRNA (cytidine1402-2'-O)-methyltransferase [Leifsonia sp. 157MF]SDN92156.1 16S rRNA (cytidine1402-2'-O)-methyltransferase [Leifsonia sp. 509MF]SEN13683.1 16S rRNA (cytidine1402-2'-O)-methyltransferase [Leifsonia sp. 467MF]